MYECARYLKDQQHEDLVIVTCSLPVVELFVDSPEVSLVVLGGEYNHHYHCTQGTNVVREMADLHIDRAFVGTSGITDAGVIRDTDSQQASVKYSAVQSSQHSVVVADASKFPGIGAFRALDISEVDHMYVTAPVSEALQRLCDEQGTEVRIA